MKLIVVGLDGASFELINQCIDDGRLPNIAKIKQERRRRNFAVINQGFKLASSLWKAYSDRKNLFHKIL